MGNLHRLPNRYLGVVGGPEAIANDLLGAAAALRLAVDGMEAFCRDSSPNERQARGLRWLAREAETLAEAVYESLYPEPDSVDDSA